MGIKPPSGPAFSLNSAVDALLKKEFDAYRKAGQPHPLMVKNQIDAIPYASPQMDTWRSNFKGVEFLHKETNFLACGAVDDIWLNSNGQLHVVDYKSTSTSEELSLDGVYKQAYKRQAEVYQWLLRMNGYQVSNTAYFFYVNGLKTPDAFNEKLIFDTKIIPYIGNCDWVEPTLYDIKDCLNSDTLPDWGENSEWGPFVEKTMAAINEDAAKHKE